MRRDNIDYTISETDCYVCEGHIEQSVKRQRDARGQRSKNEVRFSRNGRGFHDETIAKFGSVNYY